MFLFTGCIYKKVPLNTTITIEGNNDFDFDITVVDITTPTIPAVNGEEIAFTIKFTNKMSTNYTGIAVRIFNFDLNVKNYTIFDIQMYKDGYSQSKTPITYFGLYPQTTVTMVLIVGVSTNKARVPEPPDCKMQLYYNNYLIYAN